jgi:hypothetical protein
MKKNFPSVAMLLLLLLSPSGSIFPQAHKSDSLKASKLITLSDSSTLPMVHGSKAYGLPNHLKIGGIITDLTFAQAHCGDIAWAGTLKINLLNKPDDYDKENAFIVVPCFLDPGNENKYLNKIVSLEVGKLLGKQDSPCYFELAANRISSQGVSFYCTDLGQNQILRIIEKENLQ